LIASGIGASDSLSRHLPDAGICESPKQRPLDARLERWWIQQTGPSRWVADIEFSALCGGERWAGELIWEIAVDSLTNLSTARLSARSLRRAGTR
jgi:hypothetical protein